MHHHEEHKAPTRRDRRRHGLLGHGKKHEEPATEEEREWRAEGDPNRPAARVGEPPEHGPGHQDGEEMGYVTEDRVPKEVPRDGRRRRPNELNQPGNVASQPASEKKERPKWDEGHSGSFGGG